MSEQWTEETRAEVERLEGALEATEAKLSNENEAATFWQSKATKAEAELAAAREEIRRADEQIRFEAEAKMRAREQAALARPQRTVRDVRGAMDFDERAGYVLGELRCRVPQPSHEHDDSDCRACALEYRVRTALREAVAERDKEWQHKMDTEGKVAVYTALKAAVAERDREWSDKLWPVNPEGAEACAPDEAAAHIKAVIAYTVAEEHKALRELAATYNYDSRAVLLAALDAREQAALRSSEEPPKP
jgi:hypothetical protein